MGRHNDKMPSSKRAGDVAAVRRGVHAGAEVLDDGLRGYTRVHCYYSLKFFVTIGILYTNENKGGRMTKYPRLSRAAHLEGSRATVRRRRRAEQQLRREPRRLDVEVDPGADRLQPGFTL